MNDTTPREPRGTIAKRTVRPRQLWESVYESYTPTEVPLPLTELSLLLFSEGMIWMDGGNPDPAVLCQVIAQTDPGAIEKDISNPDVAWQTLVASLEGLAWGSGPHMRQAFQACCSILNHIEHKSAQHEALSDLSAAVVDRVNEDFGLADDAVDEEDLASEAEEPMMMNGAGEAMTEMKDLDALRKKLAEAPRPVCVVCGGEAEVSHPDGRGDQIHYCGIHEPRDADDEVYDTSERPEGVVRKRL